MRHKMTYLCGIISCFLLLAISTPVVAQELADEITVLNWEDYFGVTTLKDFEKEFGVKVNLVTFQDEEEMISMLQSNPAKYDIFITSGDTLRDLIEMKLVSELNRDNIPNMKNIDRQFRNPEYDPQQHYSAPYMWGTTGIIINKGYVKDAQKNWDILWNTQYQGKIAMLNNAFEISAAALKSLGYSINTTDLKEAQAAADKALRQKELVKGYFDPIDMRSKMISGELWAAQLYSGEAMFAVDKNVALEYIIPDEGAAIWVDNIAIPRDSRHKYTAEVFINYILDPQVSGKIANYLWYANCNIAARPYTLKEILKNESLYPPKNVLKRCEPWLKPQDSRVDAEMQQLYQKTWSMLQQNQ